MKFATGGYIASPPNMVCVTALPRKVLIMTYPFVCTCLLPLIITNTKISVLLDMIRVKKGHNTD